MKLGNMSDNKRNLLKNTVMMYLLKFSVYFFSFISVPYQTRVLGVESFGKLGFAAAIMAYFQILIDYGFTLSATEAISKNRDNKAIVSEVYTSVTVLKLLLSLVSVVALAILIMVTPEYQADALFYFVYLLATIATAMLPDFVLRGLEDMSLITYRTVAMRLVFTVLIFVFLKDSSQYIVVPLLNFFGNLFAVLWSMWDIRYRIGVRFSRVKWADLWRHFSESSTFFLSRIAVTIYSTINVLILGQYGTDAMVGNYSSADKLVSTGKSALAPISDSVYPYMVKHKDFRLIKRILLTIEPLIIVFCVTVCFFAEPLCVLLFGDEYRDAGKILVAMMPTAILTLPNYLLGFPTLSALGKTKQANYSIYVSVSVHLLGIVLLNMMGWLNVYNLTWLMSFTAFVETLYRAIVVKIGWEEMKHAR